MRSAQRERWIALLVSGAVLPVLGTCLPKNYFALSARSVAVGLADNILATAVSPIFSALGFSDGSQVTGNASGTIGTQDQATSNNTGGAAGP